ncbi:MAG TPA: sulfatase [Thermoanaerobaculia bacterium]|nr:sulfatase [Thermoanaerobaculia bacterium]
MSRRTTTLAALSLALACSPPDPGAWRRVDLWQTVPRVQLSPFVNKRKVVFEAKIGYLGAQEVRDLSQVPESSFKVFPHQAAGQVRTLEQVAGSRLAFPLDLGREPYFAFTPLLDDQNPQPARFRVEVREGERSILVHESRPEGAPNPAPPLARVDLSPWAEKKVELILAVEPPEGSPWDPASVTRVRWASPAVYDRVPRPPARPPGPPNLILIGVDTLRADHVGAFREDGGSPLGPVSLTPAIDRLAAESDLWLDAVSAFNVTNPSFASILTGLYGKNHGVYDLKTPLPDAHTTLAEVLDGAGYDTLAVIAARHLGPHNSALGQGFDEVMLSNEHFAAELPVEAAMDWIAGRRQPFFLWLHLFDPHTPHTPPAPYALGQRPSAPVGLAAVPGWTPFRPPGPTPHEQPVLAGHRWLYAGEVAYLDRQVDRLLDSLGSRGLLESTVIALVSDHGENLGEHGVLHRHGGLWDTTTHVPLLIRKPGEKPTGSRHRGLVQSVDLFPTLLRLLGRPSPAQDGEDLYGLVAGGKGGRPAAFSEHASQLGVSVRTRAFRFMRSAGNPFVADGTYFYDLRTDPAEERNLAGQGHPEEARLAELLERWLQAKRPGPGQAAPSVLSPEDEARLRSLGYL